MSLAEERAVQFPARGLPAWALAGRLHLPAAGGRVPGVVLCHPQPLVADMHDPLLMRLARDLPVVGQAALRFNFRGVAPSQGDATDGRLEALDVAGAVAWLRDQPEIDPRRLAIVGHAFGAVVALTYAAADPAIGAVVAVSPPHFRLTPDLAADLVCPKLFVTGADDEVSPRYKLEPWAERLPGARSIAVVPGAAHLLRGHEAVASEIIVTYLARWARAAA